MDLNKFDGRNITVARLLIKMTRTDLSNKTNIPIYKMAKYETNYLKPTKEEIIRIAYILGTPRNYFFQKPLDIDNAVNRSYFCTYD